MTYAMNEVEAMAKRAIRGAGYPWGIAEDGSKATRWLCEQGQDGVAILAVVLSQGFANDLSAHTPAKVGDTWAGRGHLCPLMAGAFLSDYASVVSAEAMQFRDVASPLMLLPFAAMAADRGQGALNLRMGEAEAVTDGSACEVGSLPADVSDVTISCAVERHLKGITQLRATPDRDAWSVLEGFAGRTYAPATEESRRLGAGAGLSDND